MPEARDWLIWSVEHDAWWGPNRGGYFTSLELAGLYTEEEAKCIQASADSTRGERHDNARRLTDVLRERRDHGRSGQVVLDWLAVRIEAAERWRAVRRTLHACSTGPKSGYYMTTDDFVDAPMPSADEYADRLIARAAQLENAQPEAANA